MRLRRKKGIDSFDVPPPVPVDHPMDADHPPADFDDGRPDPWFDPALSDEEYKGLKKRKLRLRALSFWAHRTDDELTQQLRALREVSNRLKAVEGSHRALQQRITQLEAEQHGHCATCGKPTEFPTVTWCRNVRCSGNAA